MEGLTLTLICVPAAGLLVVIRVEVQVGPVITQRPHQIQN